MKLLSIVLVLLISAVTVMVVNESFGTSTPVGETYQKTKLYCSVWNHSKNGMTCMIYSSKLETRVKTEVNGLFYNTTSYKVVSK